MPEIPMPKSDGDDIVLVNKEINEMYDQSKLDVEKEQAEQIKEKVKQEQDKKLQGMGFVTVSDMNKITAGYEAKLAELTGEITKLKQILTRAKAQGKATIETEEKNPVDEMRKIYGGLADA